jgi:hypothetical protein
MTIKTLSFLILVLWIIHLMQMKNEQEQERGGRTTHNDHQGWHFIYWDDLGDSQAEVDNQKK